MSGSWDGGGEETRSRLIENLCVRMPSFVPIFSSTAKTEDHHMASPDSGTAESTSSSSMMAFGPPPDPTTIALPNIGQFAESLRQYNNAYRALSVAEGISRELGTEQNVCGLILFPKSARLK